MTRSKEEKFQDAISKLSDEEYTALVRETNEAMGGYRFVPNEGPQSDAYFSKADVLLYGGCVSGDTEFMTDTGWKRIAEYVEGDKVAQWSQDGALEMVEPLGYTRDKCEYLIEFSGGRISMVLSENHRMPLYKWDGEFVVKEAHKVARHPSKHKVPVHYKVNRAGIDMSDAMIRLCVAINADGSIERIRNDGGAQCRMSLRKTRKIDRLLWLLDVLGIEYHTYANPKRPTEFRYSFESPIVTKTYEDWWWQASQEQLEVILEEMSHWDGLFDGVSGGDIVFNSINKCDADFIQYAGHACDRVAITTEKIPVSEKHSTLYRVAISHKNNPKASITIRSDLTKTRMVPASMMYCFKTPTSFWLARHDGKIFVTGNSVGGGKSALLIGLAANEHYRSLIVRKNFSDLEGIMDNAKKILGTTKGFVGGPRPKYNKPDGGVVHFAGMPEDGGVGGNQGVDHDGFFVDEAATFPKDQLMLLMTWLRTDRVGQRCRVVFASNPPLDSTGDWLIEYFAPWLDDRHENPAKAGELRWFLPPEEIGDPEREVPEGTRGMVAGIEVGPQSRTYIPSKFTDNPYYDPEEYAKTLAGIPDDVKDILMTGNFMLSREDQDRQVIPTDWVRAANARWDEAGRMKPMDIIAADVTGGGKDECVLAKLHGQWFDELDAKSGKKLPESSDVAGFIISKRKNKAAIAIDMGGGYGSGPKLALSDSGASILEYKGVKGTFGKNRDKSLGFTNVRSEAYWALREALDPDTEDMVCLPIDPRLLAELTAVKFKIVRYLGSLCVQLEDKPTVMKNLGRSPDRADAIVIAWYLRNKAAKLKERELSGKKSGLKVKLGYANRKKGRR